MDYYKIINRQSLSDYGNFDVNYISDIAYSLDNKIAVIQTQIKFDTSKSTIEISKFEFENLKSEFNNDRKQIVAIKSILNETEIELLKKELKETKEIIELILLNKN